MRKFKRLMAVTCATALATTPILGLTACSFEKQDVITLRVANWEDYMDLGGEEISFCHEDEDIEIYSDNALYDDFSIWYEDNFGVKVNVEYSTFGTNEDLYNRLKLGDVYDLICPSEYLIMKLMNEKNNKGVCPLVPLSDSFFDDSDDNNSYIQNVSPYIQSRLQTLGIDKYAACYMWGTTGLVYNPEEVETEDVTTWNMLGNSDYYKSVTIKDNVRDAYFATLGGIYEEELLQILSENHPADEQYELMDAIMNDTSEKTITAALDALKSIKENVYSFESDSGKADMITGKVLANLQWSGDAVFIMDEADEDDTELWYSVPDAVTNMWFDGWVMLEKGINGDANRQKIAEAFINYMAQPENAIRNMNYIGYTSSIATDLIFSYVDDCYGYEFDPKSEWFEEAEELYLYDLTYLFGHEDGDEYVLYVDKALLDMTGEEKLTEKVEGYDVYAGGTINRGRQLFTQYPTQDVISRAIVMKDFGDDLTAINQMWIDVRCLDLLDFNPVIVGVVAGVIVLLVAAIVIYKFRYDIFVPRAKKGYVKVN